MKIFKHSKLLHAIETSTKKIKYAENQGFKVLELWSSKSSEENLEIAKEFIKSWDFVKK